MTFFAMMMKSQEQSTAIISNINYEYTRGDTAGSLSPSEVYIDDIKVYNDGGSLIYSNDLESGLDGSWVTSGYISISQSSTRAKTGTYSRKMYISNNISIPNAIVDRNIPIGNNGSKIEFWFNVLTKSKDDHWYVFRQSATEGIGVDFAREQVLDPSRTFRFTKPDGEYDTGISVSLDTWYRVEFIFNGVNSEANLYDSSGILLAGTTWSNNQ